MPLSKTQTQTDVTQCPVSWSLLPQFQQPLFFPVLMEATQKADKCFLSLSASSRQEKMGADTRNLWPGISESGGSSRQGPPGDEYSLRTVDMQAKAKTIVKPGQLLTPSLFLLDAEALRKRSQHVLTCCTYP